ncbi:MAG TPA: ABC transporter substrate-binding protein [Chloroflexota bacterium]|nr:ABC transporter substrate-binding protein [Chloroflexota bacterium]
MMVLWLAACRSEESAATATTAPTRPAATNTPANLSESNATAPQAENKPETAEAMAEGTAAPAATATHTPAPPTATPVPAKELTVCTSGIPASLYLYGDGSLAATAVRHALYDNLYTTLGYSYQPQALVKLPNLADGDAVIQPVDVFEGDLIVNSAGRVTRLLPGTQLVNANGQTIVYRAPREGDPPLQMQQMVVDFTLHPLVWSDGTAVTAADSVFSFELAADLNTPGDKSKIERTASYEATGAQSVRWTGLPGFLDPTYFTNVWQPLPRQQLGDLSAAELLTADVSMRQPLGYGPFMLEAWPPGEQIILSRNPHYYRQDEGFPAIDRLIIQTVVDATTWPALLASGACDVVTRGLVDFGQIPDLLAAGQTGNLIPYFTNDLIFEHIDFGINSWNYGDDIFRGRPDWFEFLPVRQGIAHCLNRPRMVDELLYGQGQVMNAYVPDDHPLYPADVTLWPYDPEAGKALLDEFGLLDTDGDGYREWVERNLQRTIVATTTFSITLSTNSESAFRLRLNELAQEDLAACGIQVHLVNYPAETWFDDGPFSPLFGRRFDLATFAWRTGITPPCGLYLSTNITGPEERGFGGWNNINATGWGNAEYDAACQAAQNAIYGTEEYESNHQTALRIFADRKPSLPLFQYIKTAVTAPTVRNFQPDPTQPSELWNVFEWDIEE